MHVPTLPPLLLCAAQTHHPGWEYRFWDKEAAEKLLQERYSWFLPVFRSYPKVVLQSDALRAFILHAHGGVYLDLDTECFSNMEASLTGQCCSLSACQLHCQSACTGGAGSSSPVRRRGRWGSAAATGQAPATSTASP